MVPLGLAEANQLVHLVDSRLFETQALSDKKLRKLGLQYFGGEDMEYLTGELLQVEKREIETYKRACTELYEMYEKAAQYIIDTQRWNDAGIPENAIEIIQYTWENRHQHLHLYGRFDLAGVINNRPAKLIEFNADTATVIPETVVIQAELLRKSGLKNVSQFNGLKSSLEQQLERLSQQNPDRPTTILFSSLGHEEDELNVDVIADSAKDIGYEIFYMPMEKIVFSPEEGIFMPVGKDEYLPIDFWFKLVPWEFIAWEEPKLMDILTQIVLKDFSVILNPAYTMLFQSKAMLQILWELFPNHPLLLETTLSEHDFHRKAYVKKVIYGREGENIKVFNARGTCLENNEGEYGHFPSVYQAYEELPKDSDDEYYQAGLYYTNRACALSYRRRDGLIIDADSEFIGHYIKE